MSCGKSQNHPGKFGRNNMNQDFTDKNILVTGGTGFVGSHVVEDLLNLGNHVTVTTLRQDPFSYFYDKKLNRKSVIAQIDLTDFEAVHDLISKSDFDFIFHLGAQPIVDVAFRNPRRTLYSNICGTINILESVRLLGDIEGIIVASSDKAYGKKQKKFSKYVEDDPLIGDHPYEVSKSAADLICTMYYKTYGVPVVTTRFGNIYGEGDLNYSRIIPGIMKAIINKQTLEIRSDGTFMRDYLYVKDVSAGYIKLAQTIKRTAGEAFNFGSDDNYSVIDLLGEVKKALKVNFDYVILNKAVNEIPFQSLDYQKIKNVIGWEPKYSVSRIIKNIHRWYIRYFEKKHNDEDE